MGEGGETLDRQFMVPRFLEILISYIIIPLTAIYTSILVVYVVRNIGGNSGQTILWSRCLFPMR